METLIEAIYYMLPAYISNMAPLFAKNIPWGEIPINERLFGNHKTVRGLVSGAVAGIIIVMLQSSLFQFNLFKTISVFSYEQLSLPFLLLFGLAFGAGALGGDLIKSFFKRKIGIRPGKPWIPFDQLDFVIGALIAVSPWSLPSSSHIIVILLITPLLHFLANITAYALGMKKVWW